MRIRMVTTVVALTLVGYEMIIINSMLHALLAIHRLISNLQSWNTVYYLVGVIRRFRLSSGIHSV